MARAYTQLSTCRSIGVAGIGPIPVTAIWEYADRHGISSDPLVCDYFVDVMLEVDAHTLRAARDRAGSK